ncbi:conserved hypothetical protein [Magnetococcus marinus MC-1]|uniref:Uncharacterized protein n=1 Tax=Magnetococcus marinus (strain ATCC BAA-1437 / JCM 17883 / MC-1) TaxID=156889 RepID=A0LCS7_MAGMM|nr:hypothetical protein [Magnetococcus marinus]ABK45770.1 conserved hypothetical protein [Magnetococcus marinus MC-1]
MSSLSMSDPFQVWLKHVVFNEQDYDCICAIALKILDGKCKMSATGSELMMRLYDAVEPTGLLMARFQGLIERARGGEVDGDTIRRAREEAESRIEKAQMKAFKAALQKAGLLPAVGGAVDEAA